MPRTRFTRCSCPARSPSRWCVRAQDLVLGREETKQLQAELVGLGFVRLLAGLAQETTLARRFCASDQTFGSAVPVISA
jgi:hypothetical protein